MDGPQLLVVSGVVVVVGDVDDDEEEEEEEDVLEVLVSKKIEGVEVAKELKSASLSILIRFLMVENLISVV